MFGRITSTHSFESEQEEMQTAEYTFDGVGWKKKLVVIWRNYSQFQHVGLLHLVSACLFLVFYFLGNHALGNLRLLPGFVALIVTPGVVLSMALPKSLRNLGFTVVLGLLLNTILVQIQISLKLLFDITIPLYAWLLIVNTAIVLFGLGILWLTDNEDSDNIELGFKVDSTLAFILIFALVLRVVLMGFGAQSIAPDASLYSDYARSILDGSFQTNVIGDNRVYTLWNQTDYSFHQGLTYLFALSWLLLTPGISGPTLILTLSGVFLIVIAFNITSFYFSKRAAYAVSVALAIHPLFVYHSSVAYGPEITSLLFLMAGVFLFVSNKSQSKTVYLVAGICIGLVDVVWYANFLLICVALPIFLLTDDRNDWKTGFFIGLCMGFVLLARIFFETPYLFYIFWGIIGAVIIFAKLLLSKLKLHQTGMFFAGIAAIMIFWRWPIQLVEIPEISVMYSSNITPIMFQAPNPDLTNLIGIITPEVLQSFLIYLVGHIGLAILVLVPISLLKGKNRRNTFAFVMFALVCITGTLLLFSSFATFKAVLLPIYYFSDSRFFLFISLNIMIPTMAMAAESNRSIPTPRFLRGFAQKITSKETMSFGVVILVSLSLGVGYLFIPSGLTLINFEDRYGWTGLGSTIEDIGQSDSIFLVDRATEFAWLTNRPTLQLHFSGIGLITRTTLTFLDIQARQHDVEYFIMDSFTHIRWNSLGTLLDSDLSIGDSVILEAWKMARFDSINETESLSTITLIKDTSEYTEGAGVRIFQFDNSSFSEIWKITSLDESWNATKAGNIFNNDDGFSVLQIGLGENQTSTFRDDGFELDLPVEGGFMVVKFRDVNATIEDIVAYDDRGLEIAHANPLPNNAFFLVLGHTSISDIRIHCSGLPGDFVTIGYISLWEKSS